MNKTVIKAHEVIKSRIEKLRDKKQNLREKIDARYPFETYGITADIKFDEQSKALDEEIKLLQKYDSGMYDLIEIIEGEKK